MQTCDNDDDYNENIYIISCRAFLNERPFYRSLYFDSLDQVLMEDNVDNENMVLLNVELSNDILASPHLPLNNYILLHHTHTCFTKK
jgi:hypothetical protein